MSATNLLTELLEVGVIEENNDSIILTSEYLHHYETVRGDIEEMGADELSDSLSNQWDIGNEDLNEVLFDAGRRNPKLVAHFFTIQKEYPVISGEQSLLLTDILSLVAFKPKATSGIPAFFIPTSGAQLRFHSRIHPFSVVYVWRKDCSPCHKMKEELNAVFDSPQSDLSLFSEYGSAYAEILEQNFGVGGGPTTLFLKNGAVVSRLLGAQSRESIRMELSNLSTSQSSPVDCS
jgi:thiol-disulfide isomerase/thioredoxin